MKTPDALFHYLPPAAVASVRAQRQLQPRAHLPGAARRGKAFVLWSADAASDPMAAALAGLDAACNEAASYGGAIHSELLRFRLDCRRLDALNAVGIKLIPWSRLALQARLDQKDVAELQRSAAASGSDASNWWACLDPVSTSLELSGLLRLERRHNGAWVQDAAAGGAAGTLGASAAL
jgi:hypothetical protein